MDHLIILPFLILCVITGLVLGVKNEKISLALIKILMIIEILVVGILVGINWNGVNIWIF